MEQSSTGQEYSFIHYLKEKTAPLHNALEQNLFSTKLMAPTVDLQHYATYLSAMKEVVAYVESEIFPMVEDIVNDVATRRKLPMIEADLVKLRRYTSVASFKKFKLPTMSFSKAFALGVLYVVEGSTLGGSVILRHVKQRSLLSEASAFAFFIGYGEQTGLRWKNFLTTLSSFAASRPDAEEIVDGAMTAFQSINNHFTTEPLHA